MEETIRLFIAVDLSPGVREWLGRAKANLAPRIPPGAVRWVDPGAIHLTLKFLGETPARRSGEIRAELDDLVRSFRPFPLAAEGLGCFPNTDRPRVVWAGIRGDSSLGELHKRLEEALGRIGFPAERRAFSPHLTLGRVKDGVSGARLEEIGRAVESASMESAAGMDVNEVCLFKSVLRPGGAEYTVLHRAQFTG
jgi:2'-5' RNA ligase